MGIVEEPCQMCRAAGGDVTSGFASVVGQDALVGDEVVAFGRTLMLLLDAAPVSVGHSLLVPRQHVRSFAELWCAKPDVLRIIEESVVSLLTRTITPGVVVCEHGLSTHASGSAGCVEHAHLHFIPVDRPIVDCFRLAGVPLTPVRDVCAVLRASDWAQYLYLRDSDGRRYIALRDRFPSQLVRRLVAQESGQLFWSWRDYIDFADVIDTASRLREGIVPYRLFRALDERHGLTVATKPRRP